MPRGGNNKTTQHRPNKNSKENSILIAIEKIEVIKGKYKKLFRSE